MMQTQTSSRRLIKLPEVRRKTGHGTTKIYELEAKGDFPKRVKLTPRSVAWVEDEVDEYVASLIAARDQSDAQ